MAQLTRGSGNLSPALFPHHPSPRLPCRYRALAIWQEGKSNWHAGFHFPFLLSFLPGPSHHVPGRGLLVHHVICLTWSRGQLDSWFQEWVHLISKTTTHSQALLYIAVRSPFIFADVLMFVFKTPEERGYFRVPLWTLKVSNAVRIQKRGNPCFKVTTLKSQWWPLSNLLVLLFSSLSYRQFGILLLMQRSESVLKLVMDTPSLHCEGTLLKRRCVCRGWLID